MSLAIRHDFAHMCYVVLIILVRILLRVLLQDLNDLAATSARFVSEPVDIYTVGIWRLPFVSNSLAITFAPTGFR